MRMEREEEREIELESAMYTNCLLLGIDPSIIGLEASNSTPRVGLFHHSNPKLGEQLLYFILSSLRGPLQSAKDFDKVWPIFDSAQSRDFRKVVQGIISELESQGALPRSDSRVSSLATCCGPRFVELLWQLSLHALREVHRRTFPADVASNPLPASLTDVAFQHAATLLPVTKAKFAAVKKKFGRDVRVFETLGVSQLSNQASNDEETEDFYEFTAEDYYRVMATKKEDKYLKTKKIREAEEASRRSKITKAAIRVRFPDNVTLEVVFSPSEKIQSLYDLLGKVIAHPESPFYLYTTPPKKQIKDLSQDFYSAGFIPGAIVYFSYDLPKGNDLETLNSGPFLQEEIMSLKGLDIISEPAQPVQSALEPEIGAPAPSVTTPRESKSAGKKPVKPKWLKL